MSESALTMYPKEKDMVAIKTANSASSLRNPAANAVMREQWLEHASK